MMKASAAGLTGAAFCGNHVCVLHVCESSDSKRTVCSRTGSAFAVRSQASAPRQNGPPANIRLTPSVTFSNHYFSNHQSHVCRNALARVVLLGDDHLSRTLDILSQGNLNMQHIHTSQINSSAILFPPPPIRRTVAFIDHAAVHRQYDPTPLLYSVSVWCPYTYTAIMKPCPHLPFYQVAESLKLPMSRLVSAVHIGTCPPIADFFGVSHHTQLWARDVTFRCRRRTFLHLHQILSPAICHYVGDMQPSIHTSQTHTKSNIKS